MRPASLATTRLAEHWTHGLDIADPLGLPYPATERLRHVAWLAHATLPYAYRLRGETAPSLRCEPVSYTHLDVYKRQGGPRSARKPRSPPG